MSDDRKYFGDVLFEVWRHGGNPDAVDRDRVEESQRYGDWPEECAHYELRRQFPEPERQQRNTLRGGSAGRRAREKVDIEKEHAMKRTFMGREP